MRRERVAVTGSSALVARRTVRSVTGWVAGRVLLACALALWVSTGVSVLDELRSVGDLAAAASVCTVAGAVLFRRCTVPEVLRPAEVHGAVLVGWLLLITVSTCTYLLAGTFDDLGHAVFESTAGFTTTALSVIDQLEGTPKGVLLWRAATQWLGGFAAVMVVVAFLPLLGVGGLETDGATTERASRLRSPHIAATIRRLGTAYLLLSVIGVGLFLVAGMGPFDAVTYAMTTMSSGGFGNHDGSIAFFDSALVEWCTIGGMVLAGANLALVLTAARGRLSSAWRSVELRAYAGALVVFGAVIAVWTAPQGGMTARSIRHAIFTVTSAMSTTGHTVGGWAGWDSGPLVLLMLMAGVGAMSGSPGGGFRVARALTLLGVVRREIVRQLHPRSVVVVKVGRVGVEERVVSHMIGYQVAWLLLAGTGAVGLGATDLDVTESLSGAISAIATYGPALGELRSGTAELSDVSLLVLLPLMLLGRLEISPVVVGATSLVRDRVGRHRRSRR